MIPEKELFITRHRADDADAVINGPVATVKRLLTVLHRQKELRSLTPLDDLGTLELKLCDESVTSLKFIRRLYKRASKRGVTFLIGA